MKFIEALEFLEKNPAGKFVAMPEQHVQFDPPEADGKPAVLRSEFAIVREEDFGLFERYETVWRAANWYETGSSRPFPLLNLPELQASWIAVPFEDYQAEVDARWRSADNSGAV